MPHSGPSELCLFTISIIGGRWTDWSNLYFVRHLYVRVLPPKVISVHVLTVAGLLLAIVLFRTSRIDSVLFVLMLGVFSTCCERAAVMTFLFWFHRRYYLQQRRQLLRVLNSRFFVCICSVIIDGDVDEHDHWDSRRKPRRACLSNSIEAPSLEAKETGCCGLVFQFDFQRFRYSVYILADAWCRGIRTVWRSPG